MQYDENYYEKNSQSEDRLALRFFSNILKRYCDKGVLLDYGCGTGFFLKKFSALDFHKSGIELSDYARQRTIENNPDCVIYKDVRDVQDSSLDCIASLHVMEHLEDPREMIELFFSKLKFGGILFITMPNCYSLGKKMKKEKWFAYRDATHISLLEVSEWSDIVEESGFKIMKIGTDGLWDVPYWKSFPIFLQKIIFYPTAAIQIVFNRLFIPLKYGENLIIIAKKQK